MWGGQSPAAPTNYFSSVYHGQHGQPGGSPAGGYAAMQQQGSPPGGGGGGGYAGGTQNFATQTQNFYGGAQSPPHNYNWQTVPPQTMQPQSHSPGGATSPQTQGHLPHTQQHGSFAIPQTHQQASYALPQTQQHGSYALPQTQQRQGSYAMPQTQQQAYQGVPQTQQQPQQQSFQMQQHQQHQQHFDSERLAEHYDGTFPQPKAQQTSFQSFQSDVSDPQQQGLLKKPPDAQKPHRRQQPWLGKMCQDHATQILLWASAWLILIGALALLASVVRTLVSEAFQLFATLGFDAWYPSFRALMWVLGVLAVASLILVVLAAVAGWKGRAPLLRIFMICAATLGLILLGVTIFAYVYGNWSKPEILREANLLCQDVRLWGCEPEVVEAGVRRLSSSEESGTDLHSLVMRLKDRVRGAGPGTGTVAGRRLNSAEAAIRWADSFEHNHLHNRSAGATNKECAQIVKLCKPPPDFDSAYACVCSGNWQYATTTGAAPLRLLEDDGVAAGAVVSRRMTEVTAGTVAETTTTTTTAVAAPPAAPGAPAATADGLTSSPAPPASTPEPPHFAVGEPIEGPGPWQQSKGAYCDSWNRNVGDEETWCYVAETQECHTELQKEGDCAGTACKRSSAPCGDDVESRSLYMLQGYQSYNRSLLFAAILSGILLAGVGCGFAAYSMRGTKAPVSTDGQAGTAPGAPVAGPMPGRPQDGVPAPDLATLEDRFRVAQEEAVRKLKDETPADLKFQLYGFYRQAVEGDVPGRRPPDFQKQEQLKYDAWARHKGMPQAVAKEKYIAAVSLIDE